jgi:hypothetical protein
VFIGAGSGRCAILMIGKRPETGLRYPVVDVALRHGAGVEKETDKGSEAYARFEEAREDRYRAGDLPDLR